MSKNIETEMKAGKPQKQSIAIAYDVMRRAKKKKMAQGGQIPEPIEESLQEDLPDHEGETQENREEIFDGKLERTHPDAHDENADESLNMDLEDHNSQEEAHEPEDMKKRLKGILSRMLNRSRNRK